MSWAAAVGILVFFLGILISIALHEFGHMIPAKIFGVRVTQWMVGFGPTAWSFRRGETEYGLKWIPLGGYCRMIGMLPPRPSDSEGTLRPSSTGPFQSLVENAREAALEEVRPGDDDRVFYRKPWWQKVIIMVGGPAMNVVLAAVLFAIVLMGFGLPTPQPVVSYVSDCMIAATAQRPVCTESDPATPAKKAGLRPGDRILAFNGEEITSWPQLARKIRSAGESPATLRVRRDNQDITVVVPLVATDRPALDDSRRIERVGFLGIEPTSANERQGPGVVADTMWFLTGKIVGSLIRLPVRMVDVWDAAFGGGERDVNGPIGMVGASRLGGEIAAADAPLSDRVAEFLLLLASLNLGLGLFNLVPLLPLDGGHIAGALWEAIRRGLARLRRRPDTGYVDVAKLLPVTYVVAGLLLVMSALLMYADVTNPVKLYN